ncbi:MAG: sugar ABC transporter substrate-binding protein, partial [Treponema sp.]|nr:sugar ABC transporter substrate-binding protein [Treponema sp.]
MKKLLLSLMVLSLCLSSAVAKKAKKSKQKTIKIGVVQLVEHSALDANYKGFVDGLAEAGYVDGQNIKID